MKTVLLVEDNRDVLVSIVDILQKAGYEVVAAANTEQAKQVASVRADIGVMITDLHLNERMNGIQLGKAIRDDGLKCPVIVMSGHAEPPQEGWLSWMTYLAKPFDRSTLLAAISGSRQLVAS